MGPSKAPGPDGFPGRFFQTHWNLISPNFCSEVRSFFENRQIENFWNDTFIVLIPKVNHPELISQYRPIGLANFRVKVISKILTSRLKPYISQIISELQSAFTGNRCIQDNVIVVHEVVHKLRTRKKGNKYDFLFKVDMLKAFDRVSWEFLSATLQALGFHDIWIQWIRTLITTVRLNILLNGSPTKWFNPSRGLRQEDPMSPYLFILVSNVLSFILHQSIQQGRMKGLKLSRLCPVLHHVLFADDTIIFGSATTSEAKVIQLILNRYCYVSGQAINTANHLFYFQQTLLLKSRIE
ncbi:LINE-1 reverse transcriptase homolog [Linum perenne]